MPTAQLSAPSGAAQVLSRMRFSRRAAVLALAVAAALVATLFSVLPKSAAADVESTMGVNSNSAGTFCQFWLNVAKPVRSERILAMKTLVQREGRAEGVSFTETGNSFGMVSSWDRCIVAPSGGGQQAGNGQGGNGQGSHGLTTAPKPGRKDHPGSRGVGGGHPAEQSLTTDVTVKKLKKDQVQAQAAGVDDSKLSYTGKLIWHVFAAGLAAAAIGALIAVALPAALVAAGYTITATTAAWIGVAAGCAAGVVGSAIMGKLRSQSTTLRITLPLIGCATGAVGSMPAVFVPTTSAAIRSAASQAAASVAGSVSNAWSRASNLSLSTVFYTPSDLSAAAVEVMQTATAAA